MIKSLIRNSINTFLSLLRVLLHSRFNGRLKYKHGSIKNTCSILANGPSLNKNINSLDVCKNRDFFAVNFFALSEHFFRLKPCCYVFADSAFWDKEENMHPETILQRKELFQRLCQVDWELTIFIPGKGANSLIIKDLLKINHHIKAISYNTVSFYGFDSIRTWTYKQNLCMPLSQNVLIAALYIAINIGYRNIEIYGGDFSWTKSIRVDENNIVCQIDSHFYDKEKVSLSPVLAYVGEPYRMHQYLSDLAKMFEGCWQVKYYSDIIGAKIVNKNKESFIDAFTKE